MCVGVGGSNNAVGFVHVWQSARAGLVTLGLEKEFSDLTSVGRIGRLHSITIKHSENLSTQTIFIMKVNGQILRYIIMEVNGLMQ